MFSSTIDQRTRKRTVYLVCFGLFHYMTRVNYDIEFALGLKRVICKIFSRHEKFPDCTFSKSVWKNRITVARKNKGP